MSSCNLQHLFLAVAVTGLQLTAVSIINQSFERSEMSSDILLCLSNSPKPKDIQGALIRDQRRAARPPLRDAGTRARSTCFLDK